MTPDTAVSLMNTISTTINSFDYKEEDNEAPFFPPTPKNITGTDKALTLVNNISRFFVLSKAPLEKHTWAGREVFDLFKKQSNIYCMAISRFDWDGLPEETKAAMLPKYTSFLSRLYLLNTAEFKKNGGVDLLGETFSSLVLQNTGVAKTVLENFTKEATPFMVKSRTNDIAFMLMNFSAEILATERMRQGNPVFFDYGMNPPTLPI